MAPSIGFGCFQPKRSSAMFEREWFDIGRIMPVDVMRARQTSPGVRSNVLLCSPGQSLERWFETAGAFSSEVDTGSREENASKQKVGSPVLIPSEPEKL
jgi:hypothetical protein